MTKLRNAFRKSNSKLKTLLSIRVKTIRIIGRNTDGIMKKVWRKRWKLIGKLLLSRISLISIISNWLKSIVKGISKVPKTYGLTTMEVSEDQSSLKTKPNMMANNCHKWIEWGFKSKLDLWVIKTIKILFQNRSTNQYNTKTKNINFQSTTNNKLALNNI